MLGSCGRGRVRCVASLRFEDEAAFITWFRGRYDVEMFGSFLRMHGKSYDYKILYESITMLTHLRKPDERHACFVVRGSHSMLVNNGCDIRTC